MNGSIMTKDEPKTFVNTLVDNDLLEKLDEMAAAKESTRSQLIRLFIREKYEEFKHVEKLRKEHVQKIKTVRS